MFINTLGHEAYDGYGDDASVFPRYYEEFGKIFVKHKSPCRDKVYTQYLKVKDQLKDWRGMAKG